MNKAGKDLYSKLMIASLFIGGTKETRDRMLSNATTTDERVAFINRRLKKIYFTAAMVLLGFWLLHKLINN